MEAKVSTYGGDQVRGLPTVRHYALHVNGEYIADTANERLAELYFQIAERINRGH